MREICLTLIISVQGTQMRLLLSHDATHLGTNTIKVSQTTHKVSYQFNIVIQ